MGSFKLSLPDDIENPNTWAGSAYEVFSGPPQHFCWVDYHGREQQALKDIKETLVPTEFATVAISGAISQTFFGEPVITVTIAFAAALLAYLYVARKRGKSLYALTAEQKERLNDMYFSVFQFIMNRSRFINLYGYLYPLPDIDRITPPTFTATRIPYLGTRVCSFRETS